MANTKIPVELSSTPGIVDNSNATAITIDSSENVGIGTSSIASGGANTQNVQIHNSTANSTYLKLSTSGTGATASDGLDLIMGNDGTAYVWNRENSNTIFATDNQERLRITSSGVVDIKSGGTSSAPSLIFEGDTNTGLFHGGDTLGFSTAGSEAMRIDSGGRVMIAETSNSGYSANADDLIIGDNGSATERGISIGSTAGGGIRFNDGADAGVLEYAHSNNSMRFYTAGSEAMRIDSSGEIHVNKIATINNGQFEVLAQADHQGVVSKVQTNAYSVFQGFNASGSAVFVATGTGNLTITGALSKGSGSFKIDHPLESKADTHHLVHSFVEAPQADNIYRGKVDLVDGSATVNIDTVAGMTEGTFVALNTDVQCFTSNESDWDAVKGSVSGNILTISCQNTSSTATVSWLVIGERQDQHMIDTDWTDENGKVIVEPLKGETE